MRLYDYAVALQSHGGIADRWSHRISGPDGDAAGELDVVDGLAGVQISADDDICGRQPGPDSPHIPPSQRPAMPIPATTTIQIVRI